MLPRNQLLKVENLLASEMVKGAFDRMEQRVHDLTFTAIDSSTKVFQSEVLLETLQDRISRIHKFEAEIQILIEDELANEVEQQLEFNVAASVTIARLSALIGNYKKQRDTRPLVFSTDLFSTNSATSSRRKLPNFSYQHSLDPTLTG